MKRIYAFPDPVVRLYFASLMHFLIEEVLAAPDSGLPSLLTAVASQSEAACAEPRKASDAARAMSRVFTMTPLAKMCGYYTPRMTTMFIDHSPGVAASYQ